MVRSAQPEWPAPARRLHIWYRRRGIQPERKNRKRLPDLREFTADRGRRSRMAKSAEEKQRGRVPSKLPAFPTALLFVFIAPAWMTAQAWRLQQILTSGRSHHRRRSQKHMSAVRCVKFRLRRFRAIVEGIDRRSVNRVLVRGFHALTW